MTSDPAGGRHLLIRADADASIGTGHVMRCLALAQAWQDEGGAACFVSAGGNPLSDRLEREGFSLCFLDAPRGSVEDATRTATVAKDLSSDWVVADGYGFGYDYQRAIRAAGLRLMVIDDNGENGRYCADLVLNQNLHASEELYPDKAREDHTRLLLGPAYCLLRREFRGHPSATRAIPTKAKRILVTLGGSDPGGVTRRVLEAVSLLGDSSLHVRVIVGAGNPRQAEIRALAEKLSCRAEVVVNPPSMVDPMAWADLAVSACGTTIYELAICRTPVLGIVTADNQRLCARLAYEADWIELYSGALEKTTRLSNAIRTMIESPARRQRLADNAIGSTLGASVGEVFAFMAGAA